MHRAVRDVTAYRREKALVSASEIVHPRRHEEVLAAAAHDIAALGDRHRVLVGGGATTGVSLPLLAPHLLRGDVLSAARQLTATQPLRTPAADDLALARAA